MRSISCTTLWCRAHRYSGEYSGELADAGPARIEMASDRQQQLMLCSGEPDIARSALTPPQESAQSGAEHQQPGTRR
ncbi:hypothetical protein ACFYXQ_45775 [Nocardia jiangxiensis]|uniref:Uncharacterized protein n=1 Tax=Nocardia jiangxiensis TaxID=282685 RepID=A0ABW6SHI6_9NOCA